ncbi:polysaccharide deacetylase [Magnetococcus marinus MC-1]|uniref:Polysaccharide deacetylase n=1 Tax=Magnetococcus marinus (strain ATCC BAA-1437 / JCM 17883 / MC-1) TaxID=156889 RepID=A0L3Y2_MAGMM|nr:polysaccharide deacetylase family protein [Magnetococcus marinus]ABK42675.1 polysaccharide deacetylase [Magnetococcus marinus MC-1]
MRHDGAQTPLVDPQPQAHASMLSTLHIVMYHYVRPLRQSRYPAIKGLEKEAFLGQLDYIQRHYQVIGMEQLAAALVGAEPLPPRSALLTFDDGYLDHYLHVFPHLLARGLTAAFFPPVCAVERRQLLDVNKIHFILASVADQDRLISALNQAIEAASAHYGLASVAHYEATWKKPFGYDTAQVIYFKRMLQHVLPQALRQQITHDLFSQFVTQDETAFAHELYMDSAQLRVMIQGGMHVGGHGDAHHWLNHLDAEAARQDIQKTRSFLDDLGASTPIASFCYPYGGYNATTQQLLQEYGFSVAVTTEPLGVDLGRDTALSLPRLDTNVLPRQGDADYLQLAP